MKTNVITGEEKKKKSLILLPEFKDFKFTTAVMRQTRERF